MVQNGSTSQSWSANSIVGSQDLASRKASSIFLMGALLTVLVPFSPVSWLFPASAQGPELLDNFLGPPILLGALYFQWRIACTQAAVGVEIAGNQWVYSPSYYWQGAFVEFVACVAVAFFREEYLRRVVGAALVGALWAVGYAATPERMKRQAWEQVKWFWTWMALDTAMGATRGRGRRRF